MDRARALRIARELVGKQLGSWTIDSLIDNGGSAAVFLGRNGSAEAAVKVFDPELIERYGERIQKERLQRELELVGDYHPNVVEILEGGTCENTGYDYVAMKLYPWKTLKECIGEFPRDRISAAIAQLASAARYFHDKGLAHRDIKPSNIVVSPNFERVVLLDLGIVRPVAGSDITDSSEFIGTRRYSPPEFVFRRENGDEAGWLAVTFYQLGAVLHDLIMRRPLFEGIENIAALIDAIRTEAPRVEAADMPAGLVLLARACLTKPADLRLQLVDWSAFDDAAVYHVSTLAARQYNGAHAAPHLEPVVEMIRERVRARCIGNPAFPPFKVTSVHEGAVATVRVRFAPSERHRLPNALWLVFKIISNDADLQLVGVSITVAVTPSSTVGVDGADVGCEVAVTNIATDAIDGFIQRLLGQAFEFAHTFQSRVDSVRTLIASEGRTS